MVFSRLSAIPTSTLVAIAGIGGTATACFGLYTRRSIQTEWAKKPFYQDAIKALRWRLTQTRVEFTVAPTLSFRDAMAITFRLRSLKEASDT